MQHISKSVMLASAAAIVIKGENDDPSEIVTKALDDLTKSVDDRIKAIEEKGDVSKLETRIKDLETKANRPGGGNNDTKEASAIEKKAFAAYLKSGPAAPVDELKTLTVSSDPQGGYLAPREMSSEFIRELVLVSPVRGIASVRSTSSPSVSYPKRTAITNAKWKGETQAQEGSEPAFGQAEIVVKEMNTFVDVSNQLLADSAGEAETEVRLALAEDFGQKEGLAFVKGNGALEPEGLMTNADIAFQTAGSATAVTADELITLMYALPAPYRNQSTWGMNSTTLAAIRKLKDGQGNFLWQPSFQAGQPETILGRPVVELPDMDSIATGKFPIIIGDFSGYRIVDRLALSVLVNPYLLASNGVTRIHATRRVGGGVLQPAKFKKLKMA
jgi:HK97 family phage major capsid protein